MAQILTNSRRASASLLRRLASLSSGGGVLLVASLQLVIGLALLGVYEGYKTSYLSSGFGGGGGEAGALSEEAQRQLAAERAIFLHTPLDFLFWFSCLCQISALFGLAGIFTSQPTLCTIFFAYNLVQTVLSLSFFVDVLADKHIKYVGQMANVAGYEQAAAGLLFTIFALSIASLYFTVRAVGEIKQKQRESYHEMAVVSDALQFEPDLP